MIDIWFNTDTMNLPVFMDALSTTPVDPRVLEVMLPFFNSKFGNAASRTHALGWQADEAVTIAREQIAGLIGAVKEEILFTSGATESCNVALRGVAEAYGSKGNHIITCLTEHKAVLDTCYDLEKKGMSVTCLPVNAKGLIDTDLLKEAITSSTILFAFMFANNETGVIQPIEEIGQIARQNNILFFCDATQAVGKIPVHVNETQVDLLAFSAHKMYGPKGCGALYVRRKNPRVVLKPQITGGGHERGFRSGTLNVPGIAGFGKAAEICKREMQHEALRLGKWRNELEHSFLSTGIATINGDAMLRLPHASNCCFKIANGVSLLSELSKTIAVSSGSACSSAHPNLSHVLKAMGLTNEQINSSIRFGLSRFTKKEDIYLTIETVAKIIRNV
jgi:cysteine desulfurase